MSALPMRGNCDRDFQGYPLYGGKLQPKEFKKATGANI